MTKWFLENSLPISLKNLTIISTVGVMDGTYIIASLINSIRKVNFHFKLGSCALSYLNLVSLLQAGFNCLQITLSLCFLETDEEWDFSSITISKIKYLDLTLCGVISLWDEKPQRFVNLIKGISTSPALKSSLQCINIKYWKIEKRICRTSSQRFGSRSHQDWMQFYRTF